jgi:hypothetical protein
VPESRRCRCLGRRRVRPGRPDRGSQTQREARSLVAAYRDGGSASEAAGRGGFPAACVASLRNTVAVSDAPAARAAAILQ